MIDHINKLTNSIEPPELAADSDADDMQPTADESNDLADNTEYDAEIAAIFSEEAAELLEAADQALSAWTKDKHAREPVEELKRHLHTLKGGARMAGISAMGNLSHELETLLIGIDDGRIPSSTELDSLLQQSIDELHRMRDDVIAGKRVGSAGELEKRIQAVIAGGVQAEEALEATRIEIERLGEAPDSGDSVSVQFTVEPEDSVSMVIVDSPLNDEVAAMARFSVDSDPPTKEPAAPPAEPAPTDLPTADLPADELPSAELPSAELSPETPRAESPGAEVLHSAADADAGAADSTEPTPVESIEPLMANAAAEESERPMMTLAEEPESRKPPQQSADQRQEFARIDANLLEDLLNAAGEISIYHSRLSQQVSSIDFNLEEVDQTVSRLREQLRKLEIETEAQIMHGHQDTLVARDFDPLEMDRYSNIQQLSRALAESASDMGSLKDLLQTLTAEAETLLVQQARVTAELQDGLMRTRMVPFERNVPRLTRLVRQVAAEAGKRADLAVEGASGELDRQVLDKMLPPFEHMLRNAIVHGIESAEVRQAAGKPANGRITIRLHREGAEMVIDVADDGAGLDVDAIRRKAYERGLLKRRQQGDRRRNHGPDPAARIQHGRESDPVGRAWRRYGRCCERGQTARRFAADFVSHRTGHKLHGAPAVYARHYAGADRPDR